MPQFARFMCQRGATMAELAQAFKISNSTLYEWLNKHQELNDAVQVGVDVFNPRVERALAERAIGFFVTLREEVRHGRVLRARCERPRSCRTTDKRDELAPFDLIELHMPPLPTFNYIPILVNLQECFMYPHGI
jgi:transposase-like protein